MFGFSTFSEYAFGEQGGISAAPPVIIPPGEFTPPPKFFLATIMDDAAVSLTIPLIP